jgi:adenylyltransferase/sulfurtransferase
MPTEIPPELARYSRQILFEGLGLEGQMRLGSSRVTIVGCGALGSVLASTLVRAGVGHVRLCDRDHLELHNLQRQILFDERDVADGLPKAIAAARKLATVNSAVAVEPVVTDVTHVNLPDLVGDADLILDGTDNFETRYLLNDAAVALGKPWVYGAVVGATGLVMPVLPGETPCLRCVFESAPPPELNPTCDTAGVLGSAVNIVASLQAAEALKLLAGRREDVTRALLSIDVWSGRFARLAVGEKPMADCPCCGRRQFEHLEGRTASNTATLCGRDAVQISPSGGKRSANLSVLADKLRPLARGPLVANAYLVQAAIDRYTISVFADGRAIIKGTKNPDEARAVLARYVGA